jgi:hypothetical protein
VGPTLKKTAPLKSKDGKTITDKAKQMERWIEHYYELYSNIPEVSNEALDSIPQYPVLYLDDEPTPKELSRAIDALPSRKAPRKDSIPAELIKCGKNILLPHLYELLLRCWREGSAPQDMKYATITTFYKNKGDHGDCNTCNYRGI